MKQYPASNPRRRQYKKPSSAQETRIKRIANVQAQKVVNKNAESKFYDGKLAFNGQNFDNSGYLISLFSNVPAGTTITQGVENNQYVGNKIRPTHISFRCDLSNDLADGINTVSVLLIQAKQYFLPGTTLANILESTGNASAPMSPMNHKFNDRLRVLSRKTFALSKVSGNDHIVFKKEININKLSQVIFNNASGEVESGTLMLGLISDSAPATVHPLARAQWRIHYKDM